MKGTKYYEDIVEGQISSNQKDGGGGISDGCKNLERFSS
jgi:hypothetical protein